MLKLKLIWATYAEMPNIQLEEWKQETEHLLQISNQSNENIKALNPCKYV